MVGKETMGHLLCCCQRSHQDIQEAGGSSKRREEVIPASSQCWFQRVWSWRSWPLGSWSPRTGSMENCLFSIREYIFFIIFWHFSYIYQFRVIVMSKLNAWCFQVLPVPNTKYCFVHFLCRGRIPNKVGNRESKLNKNLFYVTNCK